MNENEKELEEKLKVLISKNMRASTGMIKAKELNERMFLNGLFNSFTIECPGVDSLQKIRMKVQKLLHSNLREAIGMFHSKELDESSFINSLLKNSKLTIKNQ